MAAATAYVFKEVRTDCVLQVVLAESGHLTVSVAIKPQGALFQGDVQAQAPVLMEQAGTVLRSSSRPDMAGLGTITLRSERDGAVASWDTMNETENLRTFREEVEKTAKAQFMVGSAYYLAGAQAKTPAEATMLYKAGLQAVGTSYRDRSLQDDSGQKLVAASSMERTLGVNAAAPMLGRILENRLHIWARRDHLNSVSQVR